jgi:Fe-S-cluster containining protein
MEYFDYPPKIKFECTKCGICCGDINRKERHILAFKSEVEKIARHINQDISTFSKRDSNCPPYAHELKKVDGKCFFLKTNLCSIYSFRPLICRFYPFELLPNSNSAHRFDYTLECPGIGVGEELRASYFRRLFRLARVRFEFAGCSGSS